MLKQNKLIKDILILGFAIFSMYFGAGNIIFPPYLGLSSANDWGIAFVSYFIADIGFATLAMFALLKVGGHIEYLTHKIGTIAGILLTSSIILSIGPLIALPRTGATTYEMLVVPFFGDNLTNSIITSIIYYGLILIFTLKPTTMIEILGKFLTPTLFIGLIIVIIKGIITPFGDVSSVQSSKNVILEGMLAGYQTLDVLAALAFGIIIIKAVSDKGEYESPILRYKLIGYASIVAAIFIFIIYFGLTYLGATTSTTYTVDIERASLLNNIIFHLFGSAGNLLLGIIVFLACFTTGSALTSLTAEYFSKLSHRRISYTTLIFVVTIFSIIITNIGLEFIISFASPILAVVYPGAIVLVILIFFEKSIKNDNIYKFASFGAMGFSLLEVISEKTLHIEFLSKMPLHEYGFAWILVSVIFGIIGAFIPQKDNL